MRSSFTVITERSLINMNPIMRLQERKTASSIIIMKFSITVHATYYFENQSSAS